MRVRCVCVIAAPQQPCVRVEKPDRGKGQKEKEKHRGMVAPKPHSHHPVLPSSRRVTRAREGARALHTHTHTHSLSSHPLRTPWHPRGSPSSGERGGGEGEREQRAQTSRLLFFFLLLRKPAAGPSTSPPPLFFPQHSPTPAAPPAAEPLAHACTWDPADLSAGSKKWRWGRRRGGGGGGSESSSGERGGERRRERERRRATALDTKKRNSLRPLSGLAATADTAATLHQAAAESDYLRGLVQDQVCACGGRRGVRGATQNPPALSPGGVRAGARAQQTTLPPTSALPLPFPQASHLAALAADRERAAAEAAAAVARAAYLEVRHELLVDMVRQWGGGWGNGRGGRGGGGQNQIQTPPSSLTSPPVHPHTHTHCAHAPCPISHHTIATPPPPHAQWTLRVLDNEALGAQQHQQQHPPPPPPQPHWHYQGPAGACGVAGWRG